MAKWLIGWLVWFITQTVFACDVIDDAGQRVSLKHPAKRIISLAPDLTELLFSAGAGNKIIGVMRGSDYPAAAKKITQVASYNQIDAEKIVSLHPDLIVMWAEGGLVAQVKKLNLPVYLSHQRKLTDIPVTLRHLGCLAGTQKVANAAAMQFSQRYNELKKCYAHTQKMSVFYQVWAQPLMTVNHNSWINDAITLCGGQNIFANLLGTAPEVSMEAVIKTNPDVIIASDEQKNWRQMWARWPQMNAVKNQKLVSVDADLLERGDVRILVGVKSMCKQMSLVDRATR